jgi:outer membrane protein OmpA-like peptidoglycan-associated protein
MRYARTFAYDRRTEDTAMKRLAPLAIAIACVVVATKAQDFKSYQNYDFVPGDKIVFEDDFKADTDGEFPAHWTLLSGQAVVNTFQNQPTFALTDGNYVKVAPRVKPATYLSDSFTVEFDFYPKAGGFEKAILFFQQDGDDKFNVDFGEEVDTSSLEHDLSGTYPGGGDAFRDKWHHMALAFKNKQMKCYIDQHRVLVVPDVGDVAPQSVAFGGLGDADNPLLIRNVRIATGGGMNLIDKLTKDGRIVTHGILFDVNQATIKPQSMGTINQIVKLMKDTPALKLEVGGHTDTDGDAAKNLTLSQARADAVKKALMDQGIDAGRLTTKGYGATKPVDVNTTLEGKANNRRVEFTKVGG